MCAHEAISEALRSYLRGVRDALAAAVGSATTTRTRLIAGLEPSELEGATALEECLADLLASGGKMIRPRALYLGYLAATVSATAAPADPAEAAARAAGDDRLIRLGCAVELLHVFGLLQDDVMDQGATRRGRPTAHQHLAGRHDAAGARGDSHRFGESLAVLAGDLAFALAQRQLRGLPSAVCVAWDDMVVELVQGQRLDLVFAAEGRFDQASTLAVAQAKTAAYSVARPLELGALLARPDQPVPAWLGTFGACAGEAFALADDLLGVFGDPAVTGKPVADDIRQRKPSTVLGIAEDVLGGAVTQLLGPQRPTPTEPQIEQLRRAMANGGVQREAERRLSRCLTEAEAAVADLGCVAVGGELLRWARGLARRAA